MSAGLTIIPYALRAASSQDTKTKMKNRKLGNLEVSEMGAGCMSIMANYGPPADKGSRFFGPPMRMVSGSLIPQKFTGHIQTNSW
jgi:hypothetical protein